ncbi:MAG: diguanylate cyclase [Nitrospirae bacterium]|nr:diguanylate cyclase [Nitrospirota bacterium]MBI4847260.1 diguanylate cyclase [Nitrospirota bacterium]
MKTSPKIKSETAIFKEKVYALADEVLNILKELHHEHKQQIDSKLIAEKMFDKEFVKKVLADHGPEVSNREKFDPLRDTVATVLNKFSELVPPSMMNDLSELKGEHLSKTIPEDSTEWLDSAIKIIKTYFNSVTNRINELEDLLQKTAYFLSKTEEYLASELSSAHEDFKENRDFENSIFTNISEMKQTVDISDDVNSIKRVVFNKIENINKNIEKKKELDILRLKENEKSLEELSRKMSELKSEAEAMKNRTQDAELESLHDNLTGLYNRKAYNQKVTETLANLERYNVSSSLLVCDIDFFKKINDTFGHHIGDLVLTKIAQLFKDKVRKNDFIARYGGEEFIIILPHTPVEGAREAGEKIRSFIEKTKFSFKGKEVPVTISIGISIFKKEDDATTAFERADKALYLAKRSGRNMIKTEADIEKDK